MLFAINKHIVYSVMAYVHKAKKRNVITRERKNKTENNNNNTHTRAVKTPIDTNEKWNMRENKYNDKASWNRFICRVHNFFKFLGHYWLVKARKWNWNSPVHIQTQHQETLIEYMYITVTLTQTRNLNSVSK